MSQRPAGEPHSHPQGLRHLSPVLPPQALYCSCFVPVYCGLIPPTYRGVVSASAWEGLSQDPGVSRGPCDPLLGRTEGDLRIQWEDQELERFLCFSTQNSQHRWISGALDELSQLGWLLSGHTNRSLRPANQDATGFPGFPRLDREYRIQTPHRWDLEPCKMGTFEVT